MSRFRTSFVVVSVGVLLLVLWAVGGNRMSTSTMVPVSDETGAQLYGATTTCFWDLVGCSTLSGTKCGASTVISNVTYNLNEGQGWWPKPCGESCTTCLGYYGVNLNCSDIPTE